MITGRNKTMTKIKYLNKATTKQELKKLYYELSMKLHPDHGGNVEEMKTLNNEYDFLKTRLPNEKQAANSKQKVYQESAESMDKFKDQIDELLKYPKIKIEIVGSWLWVSGNGTFAIKDQILFKKLHFEYSKANKKFYWYNGIENQTGYHKGGYLKKAIENYGIHTINSEERPVLA